MGRFQIAVFPGDGIGQEVMAPTLTLLKRLQAGIGGFELAFHSYEAGAGLYQRTGVALPDEAMAAAARADAILLGAMGLPNVRYPDGTEVQPHLDMREKFALYAGIRPVRIMAGAPTPLKDPRAAQVDCVLVRESTEGLFASRSMTRREGDAVFDTMKISRGVSERLFAAAFNLAARRAETRGRKPRVTCVDKANVIPSLAYFRTLFLESAKKYPDIEADCIYVDATALRLVRSPWEFDVLVTENMFGDILSDLGAALIGGMGMAPSADIGDSHAIFQPCHGTAPDIAGKGLANPTAMLLSAAMMLDWLGDRHSNASLKRAGRVLSEAVEAAFAPGDLVSVESGGKAGTHEIVARVAAALAGESVRVILARHRLVGVTFTLTMLLYVDRIAISAGKTAVAQQFSLSDTQFGWVLSIFALGYALFQIPAGAFVDRFGPRLALTLIVGAWSFFTGMTGLAWSFTSLLAFRLLFGLSEAGAFPACARVFYAWLPAGERGLAQGINLSGSRLGAAFALPLVAWLLLTIGWRFAFFSLALVGIVWAVGWHLWFRNSPEEHRAVSAGERAYIAANRGVIEKTAEPLPLSRLLALPNIWLLMGQYFASNFTFFFCLTWLFPYLQRTYHLDPLATGFYSAAPLLGGAVGNWLGGALVDRLYSRGLGHRSRQIPAMIGFSLSVVSILASMLCSTPLPAVLCLTLAMLGSDMTVSASWAFSIDIGRGHSGAVSGAMNMAGNLGSFLTSLAFPYLQLITGSTTSFFVVGAGLNAIAVFLWSRARPPAGNTDAKPQVGGVS